MVATGESVQPILNAILEIETFAATLRLEAVLDSVIESGMRLAGGDSGSVMLLSDDGRELVVTAAVGPRASIILGTRQPGERKCWGARPPVEHPHGGARRRRGAKAVPGRTTRKTSGGAW